MIFNCTCNGLQEYLNICSHMLESTFLHFFSLFFFIYIFLAICGSPKNMCVCFIGSERDCLYCNTVKHACTEAKKLIYDNQATNAMTHTSQSVYILNYARQISMETKVYIVSSRCHIVQLCHVHLYLLNKILSSPYLDESIKMIIIQVAATLVHVTRWSL